MVAKSPKRETSLLTVRSASPPHPIFTVVLLSTRGKFFSLYRNLKAALMCSFPVAFFFPLTFLFPFPSPLYFFLFVYR